LSIELNPWLCSQRECDFALRQLQLAQQRFHEAQQLLAEAELEYGEAMRRSNIVSQQLSGAIQQRITSPDYEETEDTESEPEQE
jgi:hypothetical protein